MLALVDTGWDLMRDLPNIIQILHCSTTHSKYFTPNSLFY